MKKIVNKWSSAKGYSFRNMYFIFSIIMLILSIIFILGPLYITDPFDSLMIFGMGIGMLIGMLIIFYLAFRDINRQIDWIFREYLTEFDLSKEKNKEFILDIIRNICKTNNLKIEDASYKGRFPIELIKSFIIDNKIQIDICMKNMQEATLNPLKSKYKYWIVIFLGPLNKKNKSLSKIIKKELDKIFKRKSKQKEI